MRVRVDRGACVGHASCIMIAPKVFDLDDEDLVVLLDDQPSDALADHVERAVRSCPRSAIKVESGG
jgi:ferredoxin